MVGITFETMISSGGNPVEGAMVCLSQGGNYFSAVSDASGLVNIPHTLTPGDALLVVTAFNTETIYGSIHIRDPVKVTSAIDRKSNYPLA